MKTWVFALLIVAAFSCKKRVSRDNTLRNDKDAQRDAVNILGYFVDCTGYAEYEVDASGCDDDKNKPPRGGFICKGNNIVVSCPPLLNDSCSLITPRPQ